MKVNAPEKLYVDAQDNFNDSMLYGFTEKSGDEDIEYVRKDAFIEKAKLWLAEIHRVCDITDEHGYRIELRELRARFVNYMKGE